MNYLLILSGKVRDKRHFAACPAIFGGVND